MSDEWKNALIKKNTRDLYQHLFVHSYPGGKMRY
jgi:hypothetical protein